MVKKALCPSHRSVNGGQTTIDFKKNSDFLPQVSDTLIRMRYLCVLSKHKLK